MHKETKRHKPVFPLMSTPYWLNPHEIEKWHFILGMKVLTGNPSNSNMETIRKGKNNENVNANLVSGTFSLLTFTSFNIKKKRSQEMKLP